MVVQHNMRAMNSNRMLGLTASAQSKSSEKLSSGYRINRAADDAAGLSISESMRRQIRGLTQASRNAQDGISYAQTAEGALGEVQDMLQRINELSVQAANQTNTTAQVGYLNDEVKQLTSEIKRIGDETKFNGQKLFSTGGKEIDVFAAADSGEGHIKVKTADLWAALSGKGISADGFGATPSSTKAEAYIQNVKDALEVVSSMRSSLGAAQNRLEHTISNLDNVVENTTAAESRVRDTDMASEMVKYSNANILAQAGQAMLAQSNQANQGVLSILQ